MQTKASAGDQCLKTAFKGDAHHNGGQTAPNDPAVAEFTFDPPKSGCYEIEEYHPAVGCAGFKAGSRVPVRIDYCKGRVAMGLVDQSRNGGKWNYVTKLPFYVGHQGKISVTRQEFPTDLCPKNDCFYMADAFRLTWVSEQCKYGSDGGHSVHDELEEEEDLRMSANSRAELEEEMKKRTKARHAGQAMQQEPEMAVRIVADEFEKLKEEAEHVMFPFQAPMDGCYMLEEMHPHHHKKHHFPKATVPYTVNYCKGRSASVDVNHTDGRHGQWNYVAHFPYFNDAEGAGVLVPKRALKSKDNDHAAHAFRYTYVGHMCSAAEAQVHRMELRTTAEFSKVKDRLPEFKKKLSEILAKPAGVALDRILVSHVRPGSVISEVTVLPAAVHAPGIEPSSKHSAAAAVLAIEKALQKEGALGKEICALADPAAGATMTTCTTQVTAKGIARPLLIETGSNGEKLTEDVRLAEEEGVSTAVLVGAISGGLSFAILLSALFYVVRRRKNAASKEAETSAVEKNVMGEADAAAPTVVVAPTKGKPSEHGIPDDTSTITPKDDDLEKASNISSEAV